MIINSSVHWNIIEVSPFPVKLYLFIPLKKTSSACDLLSILCIYVSDEDTIPAMHETQPGKDFPI